MSGRIRLEPEERREPEEPQAEAPQRPQEAPEAQPAATTPQEPQAAPEPTSSPERPPESKPPEPPPAEEDWNKRLARETREKWDARRRAELAEQQFQQLQEQLRRQQAVQQPGQPPADAVEQAKQQLRYEQQAQDFNARCDALYTKGRDEFGGDDMDQAVAALKAVGYGTRPDALAALVQLPNGHRVYRELASDLDRAGRILQLPPMAMAQEFAVMNERFKGNGAESPAERRAPVTRAPPPLTPVGGNSARPERPLSEVSMAEYIRRRDRDERGSSRIRR